MAEFRSVAEKVHFKFRPVLVMIYLEFRLVPETKYFFNRWKRIVQFDIFIKIPIAEIEKTLNKEQSFQNKKNNTTAVKSGALDWHQLFGYRYIVFVEK